MRKDTWKPYAFFILLSEAVGMVSGLLNRGGMERYSDAVRKPPVSPPSIVFPIVWAILYALMGIGMARVWLQAGRSQREKSLRLYGGQLFFNFCWTFLFFTFQAYMPAFFWLAALLVLVILMALAFRKTDAPAAWMQLPYVLWLLFAGYLNAAVWALNG